ncbi:MAG: hypothetical protein M3165_02675 [Actinomycetota bacterium]|nr:hypothetical protein [Actinomycetota bacterium]
MTEHRGYDQDLVELALGEIAEPRRSELLSHLTGCLRCRATYAEVVDAIDATVPAAPEAQPPAGFDVRVLTALGIEPHAGPAPARRRARLTSPRILLAAAAVVLMAVAGLAGGTALLGDSAGERPAAIGTLAEGTVVLEKSDGTDVGTAAVAWMHEERVLVVSVTDAPVGVRYSCRVHLAEGDSRVLGRWEASSPRGGVWVMPAPQGELSALELVTDSGDVWSTAQLP